MKKTSKNLFLKEGTQIMHLRGFTNTGIQDILDKAGVSRGAFYSFFKSKDGFGLQVIDYYTGIFSQITAQFFEDKSRPPLERIRQLFLWFVEYFKSMGYTRGCLLGNFAQEMVDLNPAFRERINVSFDSLAGQFESVLQEAKDSGALSHSMNIHDAVQFIISSWEGALILMKVRRSTDPLETHMRFIFEYILKG